MTKRPVYVKLDRRLDEAIRQYATANSLPSFTAALSFLARRGLTAEGITIKGDGDDDDRS